MFTLPKLPYKTSDLEPVISADTMKLHLKLHDGYISRLNTALEKLPNLQDKHLVEILTDEDCIPEDMKCDILFNAGGAINHSLFWTYLTPDGNKLTPGSELPKAIDLTFESFNKFKEEFEKSVMKIKGSGWCWLVVNKAGGLEIYNTANQESPYTLGYIPLLGYDAWEHCWIAQYGADKERYLKRWWGIVNFLKCEEVYDAIGK